jgi:hypothetical protein
MDERKKAQKVLLQECFCWQCESCGYRNIAFWIARELSSKHIERLRKKGKRIGQTYWFVESPQVVECESCGGEFECLPFVAE